MRQCRWQAPVVAPYRATKDSAAQRRVRANADFPTNQQRPAGLSATCSVALGGSRLALGGVSSIVRPAGPTACRSRGEPDAGPARTQHTPHVCMLKCSKLSLYCDLYHYLLDFS